MPDVPDGSIVTRLAVIDAKLDTIITRDGDHEARIRELERWGDVPRRILDVETRIGRNGDRIDRVERRLAYYAGGGSAIGGVLGFGLIRLFGG